MKQTSVLVFLLVSSQGCGVELGAHAGAAWTSKTESATDPNLAFSNRVAATTVLDPDHGPLLGAELEGRAEREVGGRWTAGLLAGYALVPRRRMASMGIEGYVDGGSRIEDASLFNHGQFYAGGGFALPIWLTGSHEGADLNASTWIAKRAVELVPYSRVRFYDDRFEDASRHVRSEIVLGAAIRARWVSDLF